MNDIDAFDGGDDVAVLAARVRGLELRLVDFHSAQRKSCHDLKMPLTVVNGLVSLLLLKYGPQMSEEFGVMLGKVSREVHLMSKMIDEIELRNRKPGAKLADASSNSNSVGEIGSKLG